MKVYKPKTMATALGLIAFAQTYDVYLGNIRNNEVSHIPLGKVAISVKIKKGKRLLVLGTIEAVPESNPQYGLSWNFMFRPKNQHQIDKLKNSKPDLFPASLGF